MQKKGWEGRAFDTAEGTQAQINYMVSLLKDEWSQYFTPQEVAKSRMFGKLAEPLTTQDDDDNDQEVMDGSVGMLLEPAPYCLASPMLPGRRPCAAIAAVLPDSPAEQAGLEIGDRIRRIDSVSTENAVWDIEGENRMLSGRDGSTVRIELLRRDSNQPEAVVLQVRWPISLLSLCTYVY